MNPAPNLVLVGPMGAGKTLVGTHLAERLELAFCDADHELERRAGTSVNELFAREGEAGFRRRERALLAELLAGSGRIVATGGGVVLDPDNRRLLRARGFVVWLQATVDTQLQRLAEDTARPLLQQGDRAVVLARLARERAPLYAEVADLRLATDALPPAAAAEALAALLDRHWQRGEAA